MKRAFFLFLLCIMANCAFAECIVRSSVRIEVSALHEETAPPNRRTFEIEQVFTFMGQSQEQDNVLLWLPKPGLASVLLSEPDNDSDTDFRVWVNDIEHFSYDFNGQKLSISTYADSIYKIVLRYVFFDDSFMKHYYRTDGVPYYSNTVLNSQTSSFFFTTDGMCLDDIFVKTNSNDLYFYSTCPFTKTSEQEYHLNLSPYQADGVVMLCFLEKKLYDSFSTDTDKTHFDLFVQKFYTINQDTHTIIQTQTNPAVAECRRVVQYALNGLEDFFHDTIQRTLYINIGAYIWQEGYTYGQAYSYNKQIYSVLSDSTDIRHDTRVLMHELTHCYMPYHNATGDSVAYLLFEESLVEYITEVLLYRNNSHALDSALITHYNYLSEEEQNTSIITQRRNNADIAGINTSFVTYFKTPYILHRFAKRIGKEYFVELLKGYYRYVRTEKDNITSLSDFEQYLKFHGVSDKDWEWLYNAL